MPIVGEVRGVGLMAALEFVADRDKKRRFDLPLKVGAMVSAAARARGLIARAMPYGDILGFAPPVVTTREDVDAMITKAFVARAMAAGAWLLNGDLCQGLLYTSTVLESVPLENALWCEKVFD